MSRLLRLPAELRCHIFFLALQDAKLDIDRQYHRQDGVTATASGIVTACRQTYGETKLMYYTNLTIISQDKWILERWLNRVLYLDRENPLRLIRRIDLDCRNRSEQQLPLQPSWRFTLAHHSNIAANQIQEILTKLSKHEAFDETVRLRVCIVSPDSRLIWTKTPLVTHVILEDEY